MGYHITLHRPPPAPGITPREWKDFVHSRSELRLTFESEHFCTVILDEDQNLALHYSTGSASVFTKNPEGPRIIAYMASIATHFEAVVTGDEGESYKDEADWGRQSDWSVPVSRTRWWRRELPRGMRILLGLAIGVLLFVASALLRSP